MVAQRSERTTITVYSSSLLKKKNLHSTSLELEPGVNGMEEDSDDEVCEVEDGFVTEDMLAEQEVSFPKATRNTHGGKIPRLMFGRLSSVRLLSHHFVC